jgi:hypothetical protein
MIGKVGGCHDTITLNTITVGLLGVNSRGENLKIQLYPNPTGAGREVVLSIKGNSKSRNIIITTPREARYHRIASTKEKIGLS